MNAFSGFIGHYVCALYEIACNKHGFSMDQLNRLTRISDLKFQLAIVQPWESFLGWHKWLSGCGRKIQFKAISLKEV